MSRFVNCAGLSKAKVLRHLYNNARPFGLGHLHAQTRVMTIQEAQDWLNELPEDYQSYDYIHGRALKVNFMDYPHVPTERFNYIYGPEAMEKLIEELRNSPDYPTYTTNFKPKSKEELETIISESKIDLIDI